jgi:hypothetical protein
MIGASYETQLPRFPPDAGPKAPADPEL